MRIKFEGDPEQVKQAGRCLEVYLGDYSPEQQYAASILLHMILKEDFGKLMEAEIRKTLLHTTLSHGHTASKTDVKNGQCLCEECHKMMHDDILWIEYMHNR